MRDVEMGDKKWKRIPGLKPHVEKVKEIRTEGLGPGNRSKKNMVHIQLLTFADSCSPRHNVISS
jgi:hypothetical protein